MRLLDRIGQASLDWSQKLVLRVVAEQADQNDVWTLDIAAIAKETGVDEDRARKMIAYLAGAGVLEFVPEVPKLRVEPTKLEEYSGDSEARFVFRIIVQATRRHLWAIDVPTLTRETGLSEDDVRKVLGRLAVMGALEDPKQRGLSFRVRPEALTPSQASGPSVSGDSAEPDKQ